MPLWIKGGIVLWREEEPIGPTRFKEKIAKHKMKDPSKMEITVLEIVTAAGEARKEILAAAPEEKRWK